MLSLVKSFLKDEHGATAIEYSLIGGLISISIITGFSAYGDSVDNMMVDISNDVSDAVAD